MGTGGRPVPQRVLASVHVPDMATAGLSDPAATAAGPHPSPHEKKSNVSHRTSAA